MTTKDVEITNSKSDTNSARSYDSAAEFSVPKARRDEGNPKFDILRTVSSPLVFEIRNSKFAIPYRIIPSQSPSKNCNLPMSRLIRAMTV